MDIKKLQELAGIQLNEETNVLLRIESEDGSELVSIANGVAMQIKKLLKNSKEWPEEVNELLDKGKVVDIAGVVNTMGDGHGWTEPDEM